MKLETIKRNSKKNIIIGSMVVLSVVGSLTLTITRAKYRSIQSVKLANGTINYSAPDLKLAIKVSEDGTIYKNSSTTPEGNYTLNTEKSKCRIPTSKLTGEDAPVAEGVTISYVDGKINVLGVTKKDTRCYIYFDKVLGQTSSSIIADIKARTDGSYKGSSIPTFTSVATGAETETNNGIFETDDPMYGENAKTYYWRGAATTNHVIFDNKCWRIIRINGDKSIRLIYNGTVQLGNTCKGNGVNSDSAISLGPYNLEYDDSSYVGWTYTKGTQRPSDSNSQVSETDASIKIKLEEWYNENILSKDKVTFGNFCNDRRTRDNALWKTGIGNTQNYAAMQRLNENGMVPTMDCHHNDVYHLSIGLITADEVQFAGASWQQTNVAYYLYNRSYCWTMTPNDWDGGNGYALNFFIDNTSGSIGGGRVNTNYTTRPVINLSANVAFNIGSDGTQNSPYIVQ